MINRTVSKFIPLAFVIFGITEDPTVIVSKGKDRFTTLSE